MGSACSWLPVDSITMIVPVVKSTRGSRIESVTRTRRIGRWTRTRASHGAMAPGAQNSEFVREFATDFRGSGSGDRTMVSDCPPDTDELRDRAGGGDATAVEDLLDRHHRRLKKMVAVHMDPRLAARLHPSDVVQDALLVASRRMERYLQDRPIPFYPWLRQIAWERLMHLHARHIEAGKRSVRREQPATVLSDTSLGDLADRFVSGRSSPSHQALREERRQQVRDALERLHPRHREVLVLRFLEALSVDPAVQERSSGGGAARSPAHRRRVRRRQTNMRTPLTSNSSR